MRYSSRWRTAVVAAVVLILLLGGCKPSQHDSDTGGTHHVGPAAYYPNPKLTPGAVFADVTATQVCHVGYTATVRDVPESVKKQVFAEYGIAWSEHSKYEVDHFISLELGGSNDIKNLWPEPYEPQPGARQKDVVETHLHREVCAGRMSLEEAQRQIADDWYAVYLQIKQK
jgi:hypothetical protein